ncbi:hypothetical protein [Pseudovibrio flavus]|uniref:hypothetical protein n=1 Tax=Pseudovibrio flavus TaxID=2529854 RepID=UPI00211C570C|nr:hypothetical protein [Pseudovibrio flavus]
MEASNPVSYAKANMARDHLRAQFAIERRQLEVKLERLHAQATHDRAALNLSEAETAGYLQELNRLKKQFGLDQTAPQTEKLSRRARKLLARKQRIEDMAMVEADIEVPEDPAALDFSAKAADDGSAKVIPLHNPQLATKTAQAATEDPNNPLAVLAAAISKEVAEMSAETHDVYTPSSPEEAAEQASEAFSKLKERYAELAQERNDLQSKLDEAEKDKQEAESASNSKTNSKRRLTVNQKKLKELEDKNTESQQIIATLKEQISALRDEKNNSEAFSEMRRELQEIAAQLAAKAISSDAELAGKVDMILKDIDTLRQSDDGAPDLANRIAQARKAGGSS